MADVITVKVNIPDFKRQLLALGQRMEKNIVRRGARAAGAVLVAEAKQQLSKSLAANQGKRKRPLTGALGRSIRSISRRSPHRTVKQTVSVRATSAQAENGINPYYWRWVEAGHRIVHKFKGKYTDYPIRGLGRRTGLAIRRREAKSSNARVRAYPFLLPAFEAAGLRALRAFNDAVADGIAKEDGSR